MDSAFLTYATKRIADLNGSIEAMEAGTSWTRETDSTGESVDTTERTLGASRAEREALQGLKGQIEAGESA